MGRTEAFPRIHPKRPTSSLISKKVLTSLVGQIVIASGVQFFTFFYVRSQEWCVLAPISLIQKITETHMSNRYTPPIIDPDELDIVSYENTALFLISSFQYILVAAVFCVGPPYQKPLWSNRKPHPALSLWSWASFQCLLLCDHQDGSLLFLLDSAASRFIPCSPPTVPSSSSSNSFLSPTSFIWS